MRWVSVGGVYWLEGWHSATVNFSEIWASLSIGKIFCSFSVGFSGLSMIIIFPDFVSIKAINCFPSVASLQLKEPIKSRFIARL